jgi:hypothetical protein
MWRISHVRSRIQGDQLLDPFPVRTYIAAHGVLVLIVFSFVKPPILNTLAFVGILLGTMGAGVLYWESTLTGDDVGIIRARIAREADKARLNFGDWFAIAVNGFAGLRLLAAGGQQLLAIYNGQWTPGFIFHVTIVLTLSIAPPIATCCGLKLSTIIQRMKNRALSGLDFPATKEYIRHTYRRFALILFILGGLSQLPLILIGS